MALAWWMIAALIGTLGAYWYRPLHSVREWLLMGLNLAMLVYWTKWGACVFLVFVGVYWLLLPGMRQLRNRSSKFFFGLGLAIAIAAILIFKQVRLPASWVSSDGGLIQATTLLGFSYFAFRLIHLCFQSARGKLDGLSPARLVNFLIFAPGFLAGPLATLDEFGTDPNAPDLTQIENSLRRVAWGLMQKFILADALYQTYQPYLMAPGEHPRSLVALSVYGPLFFIYLDFSGYSNVAIGVGQLFGVKLPENFNRPFLQTNLIAFWQNWHMSLQTFIRTHYFLPVFGLARSDYVRLFGVWSSLMIFCLWHGISNRFVILGLYQALGVAVCYLFQIWRGRSKVMRERWKRVMQRRLARGLAVTITLAYVGCTVPLFFFSIEQWLAIVNRILFPI